MCLCRAQSQTFDKFLMPFAQFSGVPGAFGSVWKGEFTIYNAGTAPVDIRSRFCGPNIFSGCSDGPFTVPALWAVQPPISGAPGVFVFVPTDAAPTVSLQFRTQDTSRESQTWGTTIPVVRAADFRSMVRLIDIPTDARFRVTLRVYADAQAPVQPLVHVFRMTDSQAVADFPITLQRSASAADQNGLSFYAELNPISAGVDAPLVGIEIDSTTADRL